MTRNFYPRIAPSLALLGTIALHPQSATNTANQQTPASELTFETASIRPAHLTPGCFSMSPPGGSQFSLTCVNLRNLIGMAFTTDHLDGASVALDNTYYDLHATTPDGQPWTFETIRPMLQQLLADRFGLVVHTGKRELPGYALILAKGGAKLHPADPANAVQGQKAGEGSQNFLYPGTIQGRGLDARTIAGLFSAALHAPVEDHTGLSGSFNIDLRYKPDNDPGKADDNLPSFFTAVEEQLGLKLQPQKVAVDTLVIDHLNPKPTPN